MANRVKASFLSREDASRQAGEKITSRIQGATFVSSEIKEAYRKILTGQFKGRHRNSKARYNFLTLPGPTALESETSIENNLLFLYPNSHLYCVERDTKVLKILGKQRRMHPACDRISLNYGQLENVIPFLGRLPTHDRPKFDFMFLDCMDGFKKSHLDIIKLIVQSKLLAKKALFAQTNILYHPCWNKSMFKGESKPTFEGLIKLKLRLGKVIWAALEKSYELSALDSTIYQYRNNDVETRGGVPLMFLAVMQIK